MCRNAVFGLVLAIFPIAGCGGGENENPVSRREGEVDAEAAREEIRSVLNTQEEAWNQGSIPAFMEGYAKTDSLRFASGGSVWYGWERTLERYEETYIDEGMMGTLSFEDLDIRVLSSESAFVFGRWRLSRSEAYTNVGGLFTLIFEKRPEGWRIVHDHTSAETPGSELSDSLRSDTSHVQPDE